MTPLTTRNRTGLAIAAVLGLVDLGFLFQPTAEGEDGPPFEVLVLGAVMGLVTLVAAAVAWRTGDRRALRAVAGSRVLSGILMLPAFFVDIPPALMALVAAAIALTVLSIVLVLAPAARRVPVTD